MEQVVKNAIFAELYLKQQYIRHKFLLYIEILQDIFPDSTLRAQVTDMTTIPGLWSRCQWHDMAIKYNHT